MIDPFEAYLKIMEVVKGYHKEEKKSLEGVRRRVIVESIVSEEDLPPFSHSSYDGYALNSFETKNASEDTPAYFEIAGTLRAGGSFSGGNMEGKAIKIMTGAPLPKGFDSIVPKEKVEEIRDMICIKEPVAPGESVVPRGRDIKKGDLVISAGKKLTPADIGILASLGYTKVKVIKTPEVGIIVTGDELVEAFEEPYEGKIRNTNRYFLLSLLSELNIRGKYYGIAGDSKEQLKKEIRTALEDVDVLITTGGVSVGDYDLLPEVLYEIGAKRILWGVNMRPGTPFHVSFYNEKPIFSLSGNPASLFASYKTFVEGAILKMLNIIEGKDFYERSIKGSLEMDLKKRAVNQWRLIRARGKLVKGVLKCEQNFKEKLGSTSTPTESNGFIILSPEAKQVKKGDLIDFMPYNFQSNFNCF